jgi:hypothetical protein
MKKSKKYSKRKQKYQKVQKAEDESGKPKPFRKGKARGVSLMSFYGCHHLSHAQFLFSTFPSFYGLLCLLVCHFTLYLLLQPLFHILQLSKSLS